MSIFDCIQKNYRDVSFDVNTIHLVSGWCSSYSRVRIKKEYHCTLKDLLEILRVATALEHLRDGVDLDYLSHTVGFTSSKILRDAFHRRIGMAPSQCRAILTRADDSSSERDRLRRMLCINDRIHMFVSQALLATSEQTHDNVH